MKIILYPNLNILNKVRWQRYSCIFIVVPSKTEWLILKSENNMKGYYRDFCCLLPYSSKMRDLE